MTVTEGYTIVIIREKRLEGGSRRRDPCASGIVMKNNLKIVLKTLQHKVQFNQLTKQVSSFKHVFCLLHNDEYLPIYPLSISLSIYLSSYKIQTAIQ